MRLLALDVGERRVGVAVSDVSGLIATPLTVVHRKSKTEDFATIACLVQEQRAGALVIGLPLRANGTRGHQARRVQRYADALLEALQAEGLDLPVTYWDEQMSTVRAQEAMIASGRKAKRRREQIDAVAAAFILQDYLDVHRPSSPISGEAG
ncbi:MAG: Holliday junction resolvase RuvX [Anaerolineae bacterium]